VPPVGIVAARDVIVGRLVDAGVRAVTDERDVNPPCVLVQPPALTFRFGRPAFDAEFRLLAIVGDTGRDQATTALDALVGAVLGAVGVLTGTPAQWSGVEGAPLPAYELTVNTHARKATP
jgi:hypothetical protein